MRVDPLQRLHTLANLAELLGAAGAGVPARPAALDPETLPEVGCLLFSKKDRCVCHLYCVAHHARPVGKQ